MGFFYSIGADARGGWVCHYNDECENHGTGRSSKSANPSKGSSIRINPAAVPIEKGIGAEVIHYEGSFDVSLVKGLGRVGAAISPSNSEETFFGPPGFELPDKFELRKYNQDKFKSAKVTLATAVSVYGNKKTGMKRFDLNLGLMGKYNRDTKATTPGGGINGVIGPFTFGYSAYTDESQLNYTAYGLTQKPKVRYNVETISAGIFLSSVIFDYSTLNLVTNDIATVKVATLTVLLKKAILTVANRTEESDRPAYNYSLQTLENRKEKRERFFGAQFKVTSTIMVSAFYNYYLLHEISLGATVFF